MQKRNLKQEHEEKFSMFCVKKDQGGTWGLLAPGFVLFSPDPPAVYFMYFSH